MQALHCTTQPTTTYNGTVKPTYYLFQCLDNTPNFTELCLPESVCACLG